MKVLTIILPNVQAMMTGVWRIEIAHKLVTLTYTDHTKESALIPFETWAKIQGNPFAIISEVQSKRVK